MPFKFNLTILFTALLLAGCTPPPANKAPEVNAGVNIIPPAMLAAERERPDISQPAGDSRPDLIEVLSRSDQNHEKILKALRLSGLVPELQKVGPFTLLAPTDEAFDKFPPGTFERLLLPANHQQLRQLLLYHILDGRIGLKAMLDTNGRVATVGGEFVIIKGIDNKVMINDVNVIRADDSASNGVIYWLDGVLIPGM